MEVAQASMAGEEIKQRFRAFLERYRSKDGIVKYVEKIHSMIHTGQKSLVIDFDDLIEADKDLALELVHNPGPTLASMNEVLREIVREYYPEYEVKTPRLYVRVRNFPYVYKVRQLSSDLVGKLISIEGIVTRVTRIDAKLVKARYVHYSVEEPPHEFDYQLEGEGGEKPGKPPYCPVCGKATGRIELVVEKSEFIDWQKLVVQEKPEEVPGGQIPRSIEVVLTADLVDSARPGDRVLITGILRVLPLASIERGRGSRGLFAFYIEANNVEVQEKVLEEIEITREDEEKIRELSKDPWIREKIIASIAPSIYGHWDIKEAIALLLFGGSQKTYPDGTRVRGDIHVLLVGDPGTAKSQLLQYTARIAPRGLYTSGKGSTAAGLTATVLRDKATGEYYLEAGALVLADGGVACLHPETRVLVGGELVRVEELFRDEFAAKAASRGELVELSPAELEVAGLELDEGRSVVAPATIVRRKQWRGRLVKLVLESGHSILLTPDHLLIDGRDFKWRQAGEFSPGDLVVSLRKLPEPLGEASVIDALPDEWSVIIGGLREGDVEALTSTIGGEVFVADGGNGENLVVEVKASALKMHRGTGELWGLLSSRPVEIVATGERERLLKPEISQEMGYLLGAIAGSGRVRRDRGEVEIWLQSSGEACGKIIEAAEAVFGELNPWKVEVGGDCRRVKIRSRLLAEVATYFLEDGWRRLPKLSKEALGGFLSGLRDTSGAKSGSAVRVYDYFEAEALSIALRRIGLASRIIRVEDGFAVEVKGNAPRLGEDLLADSDYSAERIVSVEYVDYEGPVYDLYVAGVHNFFAGGVVVHNCIDEIDKMREEDRSAIHEALEQQTVSIAKAGIVARLNARTSVLAAGNPRFGRYDLSQPLAKNIDLPPTILSRFDLLFVLQDIPSQERDRRLAKHVLEMRTDSEKARPLIDPTLLKKYISYARRYVNPELTSEAKRLIEEFYVHMRQASVGETGEPSAIAITPRQLEAIIRLAEAHARMALKPKATVEDVEEAIRLMMATLARVGFDVESGKLDIDILETGMSSTTRAKKKHFMEFITELFEEVSEIEHSELVKRATEKGFEKSFVIEELKSLMRSGVLYEPKPGKYRLVSRI